MAHMYACKNTVFTSESVSEGHPDKIADQISDAILDALLTADSCCRVACETLLKNGLVFIAGEITTSGWVDMEKIARETIERIGYNSTDLGFDHESCAVLTTIGKQSPDIAQGVDRQNQHLGAGDQGMMFGYATNECASECASDDSCPLISHSFMPAPIMLAHALVRQQARVRKSGRLSWLRPDAKSQITVRYLDNRPVAIDCVVLSTQHHPDVSPSTLHEAVMEEIIKPILPRRWITPDTVFHINPTGRFVIGGPVGDCGLTGRKIIVDTYGGMARHGGGCFSGKDPSKVDRSAAYAARYVAKNIVAAGLADRCEVQISYAIGIEKPTSIHIETFGTEKVARDLITQRVHRYFDLTPRGIINTLNLLRPMYEATASYGHFGRSDIDCTWEYLDKMDALRE